MLESREGVFAFSDAQLRESRDGKLHYGVRHLALPLADNPSWGWVTRPGRDDLLRYQARLEATDERVVLPAGTFRAARVRIVIMVRGPKEFTVRTVWLAAGTGVIKVETETQIEGREP